MRWREAGPAGRASQPRRVAAVRRKLSSCGAQSKSVGRDGSRRWANMRRIRGPAQRSRSPPSSGSRIVHGLPRWARSSARADHAKASIGQRRRSAAGPLSRRTISASCAASCPGIRKTTLRGRCSGSSCRATAPMRACDVANVGHRLSAVLRRAGHSPTRHDKLALAVGAGADDRGHLIREDRRQRRQVARAVMLHAEQVADGGLPFGDAVEVTHGDPMQR